MKNLKKGSEKSYTSYYMIFVVYLVLSLLIQFNILNTYWSSIIILSGINGIVAMSLNLINGITGQYCLGQAGFMSIGAYVAAMCTKLVFSPYMTNTFSTYGLFVLALVIGGCASGLVGMLIGIPSLRLRDDYLAIITLGFSEIIRVVWRVVPAAGRARGIHSIPRLSSFTVVFIAVVIIMFLLRNYTSSRLGRSSVSVRENELAAETMGINTTRTKVLSFVVSAFVAGVGGGLYAHQQTFINPESFNFLKSTDIVLFLYTGGLGSYSSALLGSVIFTFLPEALRFMGEWRLVIYSLSLILIMVYRPKGLFGRHEFGFMRYGEKENIYLKEDNRGILTSLWDSLVAKLKQWRAATEKGGE